MNAAAWLVDTSGFPPRWHCGNWSPQLGWLHIASDAAIFGAYVAIPLVIAYFLSRRRDLPFPRILWLFVAFIFACGTTHLIEAVIFWEPIYRLSGVVKLLTAVVSWATVLALVQIAPAALRLPGLARLNQALHDEVEERRRVEGELRESESRVRLALSAGRMGAWEWQQANGAVTWSREVEVIHGLAPGSFGGTFEAFLADVHPQDRARVMEAVQTAVREPRDYHIEYRVVLPDGRLRWVEGRGMVTRDADGRVAGMSGVCLDATDRKLFEEERERLLESERSARAEAERANRVKDEFLSLVSHELRTPLNAIMGYSQLLSAGFERPDEVHEAAEIIERNARAQAQIIEDLLDMSRITSGKLRLDVQSVDLSEVVEAAIDTVRPAAQAKEQTIDIVLDPRAGRVWGDPGRLQQIVWNLLSNAIKFTPKRGRVQVALARVNSHVEFSVADTGQGIPVDFLPHIFERFRQAETTSSRTHGGLGLGLALVKNLVELHGGSIEARSAGPGRGATFVARLPVQIAATSERAESSAAPRSSAVRPREGLLCGVKVLVVDDEADARLLLQRFLGDHGAEVEAVGSGEEALAILEARAPDVLVSDLGMPGMDGYQFIRRVRGLSHAAARHAPAAAVTAFARSDDRTRALLAGFQAHVTKPLDAAELIAVVASLAGRTGMQGDLT